MDNDSPEGRLINEPHRFGEGKRRKTPLPKTVTDAAISFLHKKIVDNDGFAKIPEIHSKFVQPIVDILEKAGYIDESNALRDQCAQALLYGATEEAVRAIAEKTLRDTDPELFAYVLNRPPEPDEE